MFQSRKLYLSLLGVVTWSATAADTILDILNATSLSATGNPTRGLAAAASALDIVALGSVTLFSVQFVLSTDGFFTQSRHGKRWLAIYCISTSVTALIVSLVAIIVTRSELSKSSSADPENKWEDRLTGQIVAWILTCLTQSALYSSPLWWSSTPKALTVEVSGPRDSVMSEVHNSMMAPHNMYMMEPAQPSSPLGALPSPTFSTRSSHSLKSWRESLHHVVRPATSKSRLVNQRSSRSVYSDIQSFDSASQDGFDKWEADPQIILQLTAASTQLVSATQQMPAAPTRGTALEAIPQSRPASPARALDGPFSSSDEDVEDLPPPPRMKLDTSRPPSPVVSESHIHPLFRSESPVPPPVATPGTSIIASPLADQAITCPQRPYSRMRSTSNLSRNHSPGRLSHAHSFTNDRALSVRTQSTRSRSSSPPSRGMTPPIPDFVLNSSPRNSSSQSLRKVSLQVDHSLRGRS